MDWGGKDLEDWVAARDWLIQNASVDPKRVGICGGSYGGYAALMGAIKTPDLFQCAISFAGVSDIPAMIRHDREHYGARDNPLNIGDGPFNSKRIHKYKTNALRFQLRFNFVMSALQP